MSGIQKVIKIFAICLAVFIIVNICGWIIGGMTFLVRIGERGSNTRNERAETEYYEEKVNNDIREIDIDVKSAILVIEKAPEDFAVEIDNKKDFTIREENGKLKIKETDEWFWNNERTENIIIKVPETMKLEEIDIDAGGGKTKINGINAGKLKIDHGAGVLEIENSNFDETHIATGAGETKVMSSVLNNLKLDAGVGKVDIEGDITGSSKIECGIGEVNLKLKGEKDDYRITAEKGIGSIKIDNENCNSSTTHGNGNNVINIERRNRKCKCRLLTGLKNS